MVDEIVAKYLVDDVAEKLKPFLSQGILSPWSVRDYDRSNTRYGLLTILKDFVKNHGNASAFPFWFDENGALLEETNANGLDQ